MALVVSTTSKVSSGFDPRTIPDCILWLDAADTASVTLSGANVTQWNDKSGNGKHAIQNTSGKYPSYTQQINGNKVMTLSSSGTTMYVPSIAITMPATMIVASQRYGSGGVYPSMFIEHGSDVNTVPGIYISAGNNDAFGIRTDGSTWRVIRDPTLPIGSSGPTNAFNAIGSTFLYVGQVQSNLWRLNGSNRSIEVTQSTGGTLSGTITSQLNIGSRNQSSIFADVHYCEILIYNGNISVTQIQQIEGYLARKWGISSNLPATHLYRSIPIVTRAFQPIDIPNCALWLDAADRNTLTLSGSNVTQWNDKSGNGVNLAAASSNPVYQTNQINGLPGLVFSGSNRIMASYTYATQSTAFVVYTTSVVHNARIIDINNNGYGNVGIFYTPTFNPPVSADLGIWLGGSTFPQQGIYTTRSPESGVRTYCVVFNGTSSQIWRNGGLEALNATGAGFAGTADGTLLALGAGTYGISPGSDTFIGTMGEVLLFKALLTTAQRQQVEGYLAAKWGLRTNLPSTHPFKLVPAVTPVFTPLQISGCQLWLDAADATTLTLSGTNVTQWNDKSGNGYNASGGISPAYSNSGVVFDGSTMSLLTSYTAQPTTETILLVCSFNASASVGGFPLGTTIHGGRSVNMGYSSGTVTVMWDKLGYWGNASSSASISAGTRFLTTMVLYNATNASTSLNAANQSSIATFPNSFFGGGTTRIGAALTSGSLYAPFYGTINEIVVYNSALSRSQYQQLEGYLTSKWGLKSSLPSTHPFKVITP